MIDVVFIHPNASREIYQDLSTDLSAIEPPIWACMIASHCDKEGFSTEILDCEARGLNTLDASENIIDFRPRLAVFVIYGQQPSASTQNMEGAVNLAKMLRAKNKDIKILFVGAHVSALPYEVMDNHAFIDFVCQNEGVYTISNLLRTNLKDKLSKVDGLGYRYDGLSLYNVPSQIVPQDRLEYDLPAIKWNKLPMASYRTALWHSLPNDTLRRPFASIYTSLGCPFKCHFCMINIINRKKNRYSDGSAVFRHWSPEFIIKQLDTLAQMGIVNLKIADEMFVLNPNHFLKVCELIIERGYKFNIWCYARVDTVKDRYLDIMKQAGVNFIALGIESGDDAIRESVTKNNKRNVVEVVKEIQSHGINVAANYIFGLPEDNMVTMQKTLDLALSLNTEMANFYCAMAYPGSPLYKTAIFNGWKLPDRYAGYSQHSFYTQPLPTKYLSADEVLGFRDQAWLEYHTNPLYLDMIKTKFGIAAKVKIKESTEVGLERRLLI